MSARFPGIHRQLQTLFRSGTSAGLSDADLLDRFLNRRDQSAFESLVLRHGPAGTRQPRRRGGRFSGDFSGARQKGRGASKVRK